MPSKSMQRGLARVQRKEAKQKKLDEEDEYKGEEAREFDTMQDFEIQRIQPGRDEDEEDDEDEDEDEKDTKWRAFGTRFYLCCMNVCEILCFCLRFGFECPLMDKCHEEDRQALTAGIIGMLLAVSFSYLLYIMMVFGGNLDPLLTVSVIVFFMAITLLLSVFTTEIRIIFLLMLPALSSNRMRWLLLMYLTMIVSTGPGVNVMRNNSAVTLSLSCLNDQMSYNMDIVKFVLKQPFKFVGAKLVKAFDYITYRLKKLKKLLGGVGRFAMKLGTVFKRMRAILNSLRALCQDRESLRYKCQMAFFKMTTNAKFEIDKLSMPHILKVIVNGILDTFRVSLTPMCDATKIIAIDCSYGRFSIHFPDMQKIRDFLKGISEQQNILGRTLTSVSKLSWQSGDLEITYQKDTVEKIRRKVEEDFKWLGNIFFYINAVLSFSTMITFILMFLDAYSFRKLWCKQMIFQNEYITEEFMIAEARAKEMGITPVLPMEGKERLNYVTLRSPLMTTFERGRFKKGLVKLLIVLLMNWMIIGLDFLIHMAASDLHSTFSVATPTKDPGNVTMSAAGSGLATGIMKIMIGLTRVMQSIRFKIDPKACTPDVSPVDMTAVTKAGVITGFVLFAFVFEGFLLRTRHAVMTNNYPQEARERALWLRGYILQNRGIFRLHKFARPLETGEDDDDDLGKMFNLRRTICRNKVGEKVMRALGLFVYYCRTCAAEGDPKKPDFLFMFVQCVQCQSVYCRACHNYYGNQCLICFIPLVADFDDIDRELCSSEEEMDRFLARYLRPQDDPNRDDIEDESESSSSDS